MPETIEHKANPGSWKAGQSGNPTGRPKNSKSITDALRKRVENGGADKIAESMLALALTAKQEAVRVKAGEFVTDRLEGRPLQAVAMLQMMDENTAKRLIQVAETFTRLNVTQPAIQHEILAPALPSLTPEKR